MSELNKVLELLEKERQRLEEDIAELKADNPILDGFRDLNNSDDDDAGESEDSSRFQALTEASVSQLKQVERAIAKIHEGTYGKDDLTGDAIPEERLKVIPWAVYTVESEEKLGG